MDGLVLPQQRLVEFVSSYPNKQGMLVTTEVDLHKTPLSYKGPVLTLK